ncbi:hypothetical protein BpHYR1_039135, partial [Brachionus plicatilis]
KIGDSFTYKKYNLIPHRQSRLHKREKNLNYLEIAGLVMISQFIFQQLLLLSYYLCISLAENQKLLAMSLKYIQKVAAPKCQSVSSERPKHVLFSLISKDKLFELKCNFELIINFKMPNYRFKKNKEQKHVRIQGIAAQLMKKIFDRKEYT